MKQYLWLLIPPALGALVIAYHDLPFAVKANTAARFANGDQIVSTAMQVEQKFMPPVVQWSGELGAVEAVDVIARVPGQIREVRAKTGDIVTRGQVLATVHSVELLHRLEEKLAALEAAKMDLQQEEAQLVTAEREFDEALLLRNRDLISGKDLAEAQAIVTVSRARRALAQTQVTEEQALLDQTRYVLTFSKLLAPFSGVVIRWLVGPGAYVQASTPVLMVAPLDTLKVEIDIAAGDVDFVREGMIAEIRADSLPDRVFEGRVTLPRRLKTTQTAVADIQLSNRDRLLTPGMRVKITLLESGQPKDAPGDRP